MEEITDKHEIEQYKEGLLTQRLKEQGEKGDFDYDVRGNPEQCDDCGNYLNSHGHCPRCDY